MEIEFQPVVGSRKPLISSFWLTVWAVFLSSSWLLPTHLLPWSGFHADMLISLVMLAVACVILMARGEPVRWHWLALLALLSAMIPLVQYSFGLIYFIGQAWISALYVLGFFLALIVGQRWNSLEKDQAMDGLFLAIGIASIISVGLQLYQWFEFEGLDVWVMPSIYGRPYANLAQPNKLGTFLCLGLIAGWWGYYRNKIGFPVALLMSGFLVFGIALTQSRTAMLGIGLVVALAFYWRKYINSRRVLIGLVGLLIFLMICLKGIPIASEFLLLESPADRFSDVSETLRSDLRLSAYRLFIAAVFEKPWFGYGWFHVGAAQFAVADKFPALDTVFLHSHNLFLDLVLWVGIPIGGIISIALCIWVINNFRSVADIKAALLSMFVMVAGLHAMFELPLHYATFLLPTGLVMGVLNSKAESSAWTLQSGNRPVVLLVCLAGIMLCLVTVDYFRIEKNLTALRFERSILGKNLMPLAPPEVFVLTQLKGFLVLGREKEASGLSANEIERVRQSLIALPNPGNFFKLIQILVLNDRANEAQSWITVIKKTTPPDVFQQMALVWRSEVGRNPKFASVNWQIE